MSGNIPLFYGRKIESFVFVCMSVRVCQSVYVSGVFFCVCVCTRTHACEKTKTSWMNYMICNDKWSQTFTEAQGLTYIYRLEK